MNHSSHPSHRTPRRGFSLVEVTIAIGVVSFALLAILGTLSIAHNSSERAARSGHAGSSAAHLLATLRDFPTNAATISPDFPLPALTANMTANGTIFVNSAMKTTAQNAAEFRLRYRVTPHASDNRTLFVTLRLDWPAQAATPTGSESLTGTIRLP